MQKKARPQNEVLLFSHSWHCHLHPNCVSLPFIRNHDFARNSTKGFIFKAFRVFSSRLHGRLKKETVNLSLKNANLCLGFALVHFILTNHFCGESLFLWLQRRAFWGVKEKSGVGPKGPGHFYATYRVGLWGHPINFHPLPSAEGRILPSTALRVENHMRTHRAR